MTSSRHNQVVAAWLALALAAGPRAGGQPPPPPEPPQALKLRLSEPFIAGEMEYRDEKAQLAGAGTSSRDTTLDFTPSAGFSYEGSLYHPSVLSFDGLVEQGLTLGRRTYDDGTRERNDDRDFRLQRYNLDMTLLREKPYAATLYANRTEDRRDYGDLQRFTTDSDSYGVRLGYRTEPVPVTLNVGRWEETIDDPDRPTTRRENTATLTASNTRDLRDSSRLNYSFVDYRQEEQRELSNEGRSHTVNLNDLQYFGRSDRARLNSSFYFNDIDSSATATRTFNLREDLSVQHSRHLASEYAYTFDRNSANGSTSTRNTLEGDLTHRLAASLESRVGAMGEIVQVAGGVDQRTWRAGPRASENYTKRLSSWGRLRLNAGVQYLRETQDTTGGGTVAVIDEEIRLTDGQPAFLGQSNVDQESIVVTDQRGSTLYLAGPDYTVARRGSFTEIARVFGGRIPNGSIVSVSYQAQTQPDATVNSWDNNQGAELSLFRDRLAFYVTRRQVDISGGSSLTFQAYEDVIAGTRGTWRWTSAGYERGEHTADELDFTSDRTWQQVSASVLDGVVLSLDASQARITYPDIEDVRRIESYHARCNAQVLSPLWVSLTAGSWRERTDTSDRDVRSAEAGFTYRFAKLQVRGSWRYEDEDNSGEKRERNWIDLRIVRRF